jgi:hypothetical protein
MEVDPPSTAEPSSASLPSTFSFASTLQGGQAIDLAEAEDTFGSEARTNEMFSEGDLEQALLESVPECPRPSAVLPAGVTVVVDPVVAAAPLPTAPLPAKDVPDIDELSMELAKIMNAIKSQENAIEPMVEEELSEGTCSSIEKSLLEATQQLRQARTAETVADKAKLAHGVQANLRAMEHALAAGEVNPRTSLGVMFRRELDKNSDQQTAYKEMNRAKQAKFRVDWLSTHYGEYKQEKLFKASWRRVDSTKGEYLPLSIIVQKEGHGSVQ